MREDTREFIGERCRVIGVLDDGAASLSETALRHLARAEWVIGGTRTLQLLAAHIAPGAQQRDAGIPHQAGAAVDA